MTKSLEISRYFAQNKASDVTFFLHTDIINDIDG